MNATDKFIASSAHVDEAAIAPLPNSRKIYVEGSRPDIRVPMREISQADTPTGFGGEKNPPIFVYDCSGPYTDPTARIDIRSGLPALRQGWITLDLQEGEPAANLDAVPGAVVLPELGRAPTPLDVEQAAHAATKEELRIALEALASSRGPCHPGDRCSHWPECEICGPPRM